MRHGKLIAGLILLLVVAITVGSLTAYRLVKRAFGNPHAASRSTPGQPSNKQSPSLPIASPPFVIRGAVMAQAFRSGRLPAPMPQPEGSPEQAAAELAKRVAAQDEQSTAALLTALQMSGFSVRADDGSMALESVKPGQGIVIDAWEAAALAKLFGDGMHVRLADFSNAFARTSPSLKDAPVDALLLDGIRAAAHGNQPAMRFWADFIAELGRHSENPYDLLAPDVDTTKVALDAIQISLILRRLAADFMLVDGNKNKVAEFAPSSERDWPPLQSQPASYNVDGKTKRYLHSAVWHPDNGPRLQLIQEGGGGNLPCTLKELEAQILDINAYGAGKAFDQMLEYMTEHGMHGAEKYGTASSIANAVLALIKLYAYYACMETDITMSGEPPLVRTQKLYQNGEKRTLTASVRENIGKWQALNCVRLALNGANLDISLPNDGPVAGVKTQWVLVSGSYDVHHGDYTTPIVELVFPDGTPLVQNATVPVTDASAPKTDEEGHTTIDIEGLKQKEQLVKPLPLLEQAEVRFTVAAKAVTMRQDLIDAFGNGLGFPVAGAVGLGFGGPVEMLLRSNIYFSKALYIPVKDWNSCDGGWGGTISYTTTFHFVHNSQHGYTSTEAKDETTIDQIQLRGNPDGGTGWSGSSLGTYTATFNEKDIAIDTWPPASRPGISFGGATIKAEETTTAVGAGQASIEISPQEDNKYRIGATSFSVPSVYLWHQTCSGDCKGKTEPDRNSTSTYSMGYPALTVQADPNQPGVLRGDTTLENTPMRDATTTIRWNLMQCQDRQ